MAVAEAMETMETIMLEEAEGVRYGQAEEAGAPAGPKMMEALAQGAEVADQQP